MKKHGSGLLLHPTSLPSPYAVGDLGPEAHRFVDFLHTSSQRFWQILPLNPTGPLSGYSPYNSVSAFARNPLLISPDLLVKEELLQAKDIIFEPNSPQDQADYETAWKFKYKVLNQAFSNFTRLSFNPEYHRFCRKHAHWLEDFALFQALKRNLGPVKTWNDWPEELRTRRGDALSRARKDLREDIDREKFFQYLFFKQWEALREYCKRKQVHIIGDLPIYLHYDSVDVWVQPELFKLDQSGKPIYVSGVPPDYFSDTGQLWGNPVYDWDYLQRTGFEWWIDRLAHNLDLFDMVRIDHFRGFVGSWEVPFGDTTALNGHWAEAPARDFFHALLRYFPYLPIIAEDLGEITADVREIISIFEVPGMKVLLFAFGEQDGRNPFLPHNFPENCVAYTGTHDTNTLRGWWEEEATSDTKARVFEYLGRKVSEEDLPWEMIRLGMMSVAWLMITPVQDLLGLPASARMNRPASSKGNWLWRLLFNQLDSALAHKLAALTKTYGRD